MLDEGKISWNRAKAIAKAVQDAPAGKEREVLEQLLGVANGDGNGQNGTAKRRPLTFRSAKQRLTQHAEKHPEMTFQVNTHDLLSLLLVLEGKQYEETHLQRVRSLFPQLVA